MSQTDPRPPLNPTVEDVNEAAAHTTNPTDRDSAHTELSWSEICAKHESVLSSHFQMLNLVQNNIKSNGDTYQMISGMMEKTNRLMTQFQVVKKRLGNVEKDPEKNSAPSQDQCAISMSSGRGSSKRRRSRSKERRKRPRGETDSMEESEGTGNMPGRAVRHAKRKRLDIMMSGHDEDVRNVTPVALETEDISEEVQRRLEIKEEQRSKRTSQPEKRKRDSLASTGSHSSLGSVANPKKRAKIGTSRDSMVDVPWKTSAEKKNLKSFVRDQRSDVGSSEERRGAKRQKRRS
ncbi:hypothetical protein BDV28DRAFT_155546 [Aspergillus coremiiformis]|uniref:Uncharacterized protein n=1 Tax=Aspergillus coremiiformis TaxID=138285 RepID=A0A5N6ZCQ4_9EURO|nr:hypothetical protein BDV28DRAFT_155546 [Aspergillus coremiiformis]